MNRWTVYVMFSIASKTHQERAEKMTARQLDDFLDSQKKASYKSHKKLARIAREAYPIGVPALIMKSSTDRLGASAGYSFI